LNSAVDHTVFNSVTMGSFIFDLFKLLCQIFQK
jgi:hypothetical protein